MGVKVAVLLAAIVVGVPMATPTEYVLSRHQPDGGFAEPGGRSDPGLTAWAVIGLGASGSDPAELRPSVADYLRGKPYPQATDLALRILALKALGEDTRALADQLESLRRPNGRIGALVNSTVWGVIALRAVGRPAGDTSVRYLMRQQRPSGGWSWYQNGRPDSNDTAAALRALLAARVSPRSAVIRRGVAYLERLQRHDGGLPLLPGRPSDAQSTAWAIQAPLGKRAAARASRFLASLRRTDGSYRYSRRLGLTPAWVTAQALAAFGRTPTS